ncbi:MAG: hypothetical protein JRI86_13465 [Deltaproteobacteria bacterium]|nr:hypothetical protein [Deltaproteobacteria bacterium]
MWEYASGTTWNKVNTAGFGDTTNNVRPYSMVAYNGKLYVGGGDSWGTGTEVWCTGGVGGPPFTDWVQANSNGFGDSNNVNVRIMAVYDGKLYVGTGNPTTGAEIWCTGGVGGPPYTDWAQVNSDGFGDTANTVAKSMAVYDGMLYTGTWNAPTGGEVWRTMGAGGPPFTDWEKANTGGFGDSNNIYANSMASVNPLYVGTYNESTGTEVWRYEVSATTSTQYTLTMGVSSGNGSTIPAVGDHDYDEGTVVNITAIPDSGWEFDSWTGDVANTALSTTTVTMNSDKTVTALFTEIPSVQYTLTTLISPSGGGSITASGIDCPGDCSDTYDAGTVVTITATPVSGWQFDSWTGGVANTALSTTTVTMDSDKTVTALFTEIPSVQYTLTMGVIGYGSTTPAVGAHAYDAGTVVDITAIPDSGWEFVKWTGGVAKAGLSTTTVTMNSDKTVTATFTEILPVQYTLTMQINGNGSTTPAVGEHHYYEGTVVDITATPDSGWDFVSWTGGIADTSSVTTTVTMNSNKTVTATFIKNSPPDRPTSLNNPADGAIIEPDYVNIHASAYSDPDNDEHVRSHWQVRIDGSIWNRHDYDDSFDYIADSSVTDIMTEYLVSGITVGMKYYWRVGYVDSGSGTISTSKEYSFLVGEESSCLSPVHEGNGVGDTVFDYRMISFPHWPRISIAEKLFDLTDDPTVFRAGTYMPGSAGYREYGQWLRIRPGIAYWVLSRDPVILMLPWLITRALQTAGTR